MPDQGGHFLTIRNSILAIQSVSNRIKQDLTYILYRICLIMQIDFDYRQKKIRFYTFLILLISGLIVLVNLTEHLSFLSFVYIFRVNPRSTSALRLPIPLYNLLIQLSLRTCRPQLLELLAVPWWRNSRRHYFVCFRNCNPIVSVPLFFQNIPF